MRFAGRRLCRALLVVTLIAPPALSAGNLVVNSTFDRDTSGWSLWGGQQMEWNGADAHGSSSSGSVLVTNAATIEGGSQGIQQCVVVEAGKAYVLSGRARMASGQASTGYARGFMQIWDGAGCTGNLIPMNGGLAFEHRLDAWMYSAWAVTMPAGARSGLFVAMVVKDQATGTLSASFDDLALTPTSPSTLTVPASASIHGAAGAFFHTDLWVVNKSHTNQLTVTASFRCLTGTPCEPVTKVLMLAPRQARRYTDVVATLFGRPEKAGPIELTYEGLVGDLAVSSRTYTPELPAATNGTGIPALGAEAARKLTIFPGLASNAGDLLSGFRSNAGAYNPAPNPVAVTFTMYDEGARALGKALTRTWQPYEAIQLNDIFGQLDLGQTVTMGAYLVVEASTPVFAYVTVIDNKTGDSIFLAGSEDEPLP